ncbi:hypothetical protein P885DRAFT_72531 [Corynascus similis CBS 632.67]
MEREIVFDRNLTKLDGLVLQNLTNDLRDSCYAREDTATVIAMQALNNSKDTSFEPTVFNTVDLDRLMSRVHELVNEWLLQSYVRLARRIVRVETDVMMLTHLIMYFTTSVPSAAWLFFYQFTWVHGLLHFVMQVSYMSTYTLMMHQHIDQRGVLAKPFALRDSILHFLHYEFRFFLKNKLGLALQTAFWGWLSCGLLYLLFRLYRRPAFCVFLIFLLVLRLGLMVGNFGQHARHWRDHPVAFLKGKETYTAQHALVFHDINYIMITIRLLMKDYEHLANMEERVALLKRAARKFTEEEIQAKFRKRK